MLAVAVCHSPDLTCLLYGGLWTTQEIVSAFSTYNHKINGQTVLSQNPTIATDTARYCTQCHLW